MDIWDDQVFVNTGRCVQLLPSSFCSQRCQMRTDACNCRRGDSAERGFHTGRAASEFLTHASKF